MEASLSPHFVPCSKGDWPPPAHICPPFIILFAYYFFIFFIIQDSPRVVMSGIGLSRLGKIFSATSIRSGRFLGMTHDLGRRGMVALGNIAGLWLPWCFCTLLQEAELQVMYDVF